MHVCLMPISGRISRSIGGYDEHKRIVSNELNRRSPMTDESNNSSLSFSYREISQQAARGCQHLTKRKTNENDDEWGWLEEVITA